MSAANVNPLYGDLQKSFNKNPCDIKKCGLLLSQLKVVGDWLQNT
jgi:hypothetical protein